MAIQKENLYLLPTATYGTLISPPAPRLDVLLYTGSGTKDKNQTVGPDGPDNGSKGDYAFEDPVLPRLAKYTIRISGLVGPGRSGARRRSALPTAALPASTPK